MNLHLLTLGGGVFAVFLVWLLDVLFATWFFWPVALGIPLVCNMWIHRDGKYPSAPWVGINIVILACLWRYPALRLWCSDWHNIAWALGGYVVIGFLVSLFKWVGVLRHFKRQSVKEYIVAQREKVQAEYPHNHSLAQRQELMQRCRKQYPLCKVIDDRDGYIIIWPDRDKYPIGTWWSYWPFFVLSVIFDPVQELIVWLAKHMRAFYDSIARWVSARA